MPKEAAELEKEETNLREDIEGAIDEIQKDTEREPSRSMDGLLPDEEESAIGAKAEAEAGEAAKAAEAGAEAGKEKEPEEPEKKLEPEKKAEEAELGKKSEKEDVESQQGSEKTPKAPVGWNPKAREEWVNVPPEAQQMILEREKEIAITLQQTQQARHTHDAINQLATSFAPIMAAEGVSEPLTAIKGLFETVAQLRVGTPEQKAGKMAQLIQHYGIDVQALDNALVGESGASPDAHIQSLVDQKLGPVNQLLQELQGRGQANQQASMEQAQQEVDNFQGEFLENVRLDMADLIDMAAARGQQMTLQDAYDKAVLLHPEIQEVLDKRASDAALLNQQENLDKKKNASSSIAGEKGGEGGAIGDESLRDTISSAWDEQGGSI